MSGEGPFDRAVDVACETGDSTMPLVGIAKQVEGVDLSGPMLAHAKAKGLVVRQAPYTELERGAFDLISVCMAYHWFDADAAISAFKRASMHRATWLIYNFALLGHKTDESVSRWLKTAYLSNFPDPPRGRTEFAVPATDRELRVVGSGKGALPVQFSRSALIGYLTTQSNVQAALHAGRTYQDIEAHLDRELPEVAYGAEFLYGYSYSVVQFQRA
ncbi:class I SAM-dependent methyltransferase [Schlegelella sp. S2-27]|uniref:Class I SAM-dependent methyltransferase n=1 Tax=Caldimonas mangrovi TaxID=2944811 RepID=A0ABT0YP82_9BURK|nr:class I SAM-dependent methyltransferase [Caldimonas mangrovi]